MAKLARRLNLTVRWSIPQAGGRSEVFIRDIDMVSQADLLLAVFSEGNEMQGGTGHLVEKAQDFGTPTYAYTFFVDLQRVGEEDPEDRWSSAVPA